jgi:hypothetical protein
MAFNRLATFKGSDSKIAFMLAEAKSLIRTKVKDPVVKKVVCRIARMDISNGEQIGTVDVIRHISKEISHLQKTNEAITPLDPENTKSTTELSKQKQDYHAQTEALLAELKNKEASFEKEIREILEQLQKAPNPSELLNKIPQFLQRIAAIEQQSEELHKKAASLLTAVQHTQRKNEDKYISLYFKQHGVNPPAIEKEKTMTRPRVSVVNAPTKTSDREKSGPSM